MENQENNKSQAHEGVALRLKRIQGEERPTFANNFVFQLREDEFHIRFYQVSPPIVLGESAEERKAEIEELDGVVEAPCVSHIVITGSKIQEFFETLNKHFEIQRTGTTTKQGDDVNGSTD